MAGVDRPALFWEVWRSSVKQHTGVLPRLSPNTFEAVAVLEITDSVDSDEKLKVAVDRFLTMPASERAKCNVKALTLGFFRMALPALMQEQQQDETEKQKFLDSGVTYR